MAKLSQTQSGKAWEYGLAKTAAEMLAAPLEINGASEVARVAYGRLDRNGRERIDAAATAALEFLCRHDDALKNAANVDRISMQSDMKGAKGDVRDVLVHFRAGAAGEIGVSAKHRHKAVKHSRLSPGIDFGQRWYGVPCSARYWDATMPIWEMLSSLQKEGRMWREVEHKPQVVYAPIIRAFIAEVKSAPAKKLLGYMLGEHDYYKIIKENGNVILQSINLGGTLGWGKKVQVSNRIIEVKQERDSTAVVTFDKGWALSFRLHSAEKYVRPSLKFDVNLVGFPLHANNTIAYLTC